MIDWSTLVLYVFAFGAGFIDSIAGGGGLIQLPALLLFSPGIPVATIMGSNKFAAFSGTAVSTYYYTQKTEVPWKSLLPALLMAMIFSFLGAEIMSAINQNSIKIIVLVIMVLVALFTFIKKDFGHSHHPKLTQIKIIIFSLLTGTVMGFYDGFFGPGTGSFLIIIFIHLYGFNFLISSASAKLVNCATSVSALIYFIYTGQIIYTLAIPVALFNMGGSLLGTRMAIKKGSAFVRIFFLIIVSLLVLKLSSDILGILH